VNEPPGGLVMKVEASIGDLAVKFGELTFGLSAVA
jgi:hypothetical protein